MKKVSNLINLLIFSFTSIICIGICELLLRKFAPPPPNVFSVTGDTSKASLYGWATPPNWPLTSVDQETGEAVIEKSNSEGWKDVEHSFDNLNSNYRIVVIGDSHTVGIPKISNLYPKKLEKILKERGNEKVEVIIMASSGWSSDQELLALETEGLGYKPNLVILQWCENDLDGNMNYEGNEKSLETAKPAWARPYMFKFVNGKLEKIDYSDKFEARKKLMNRNIYQKALSWLSHTAWAYNLGRAYSMLGPLEVKQEKDDAGEKEARVLSPIIQSSDDAEQYKGGRSKAEFETAHKVYIAAQKEKIKQIKAGTQAERVSYLSPNYEPFPYKKGPYSVKEKEAWALMEGILKRMNELSNAAGAKFIVFSEDGEEGKRIYFRSVGNIKNIEGVEYIDWSGQLWEFDWNRAYMELENIAAKQGFQVVPFKRIYHRWSFDNHPNVEGNENMALDIADFLENTDYFQKDYNSIAKK